MRRLVVTAENKHLVAEFEAAQEAAKAAEDAALAYIEATGEHSPELEQKATEALHRSFAAYAAVQRATSS
jgi:hypothetical protein